MPSKVCSRTTQSFVGPEFDISDINLHMNSYVITYENSYVNLPMNFICKLHMNSYVNLDLKFRIQNPQMTKLFDYKLQKALKLKFTKRVSVCSCGY